MRPKISIAIPTHNMAHADSFLGRIMRSLEIQTFRDFEIVITKDGRMAENTNAAIRKCKGDIIKILYMDDYLANPHTLENIAKNFKGGWLATGCVGDTGDGNPRNPHRPSYDGLRDMSAISNTIGSPSVIAIENNDPLLFDENLGWVLDIDYYKRLYARYGEPTLLDDLDVVLGIGDHQATNILTKEEKDMEESYFIDKWSTPQLA